MSRFLRVAAVALAFAAAGCSIHPVPEEVTGVDTLDIVKQIRCEARNTLRTLVIDFLQKQARETGDPFYANLAAQYQNNPASINTFHYNLFRGPQYAGAKAAVKLFYDAGIAYNFDLLGSETNNVDPQSSFIRTFFDHKATLGLTAGSDRIRANDRAFTATDTFGGLLTTVGEDYCIGHIVIANYIYPIAGRIGLDNTMKTFINLTLFGALGGPKDTTGKPPTMTDTLTFTTTFKLGVNPMVVFTPVTAAWQLLSASMTTDFERMDRHQVAIGLAIGKEGMTELQPLRSYYFSGNPVVPTARRGAIAPGIYVGNRVIGGGTMTETLAVIAVDQVKSQEIKIVPNP
jgi:hypothetical protein